MSNIVNGIPITYTTNGMTDSTPNINNRIQQPNTYTASAYTISENSEIVPTAPPYVVPNAPVYSSVVPLQIINDSNQYNVLHTANREIELPQTNSSINYDQQFNYSQVGPHVDHPLARNRINKQSWGVCKGCQFQFIRCEKDKKSQSYFYCDECVKNNLKKRCCASCSIS